MKNHKRDYVSYSALKAFSQSPNHYIKYVTEKVDTDAFRFGRALHCAILEMHKYNDEYIVAPTINRRTNVGKAEWADFVKANKEKTVLTKAEQDTIDIMVDKIHMNPEARELLSNAPQREVFLKEEMLGIECRGVCDAYSPERGFCLDLKTTTDASRKGFTSTMWKYCYYGQAAMYTALTKTRQFYWIVAEKTPPYNVAVYIASDETLLTGRDWLQKNIENYRKWDGKHHDYFKGIQIL